MNVLSGFCDELIKLASNGRTMLRTYKRLMNESAKHRHLGNLEPTYYMKVPSRKHEIFSQFGPTYEKPVPLTTRGAAHYAKSKELERVAEKILVRMTYEDFVRSIPRRRR